MNRTKTERIISELPNVLKWNTSTRGHQGSIKIESNSLECNGTMYVIKIDGNTRKYDLSAVGVSDTSHEWLVQLEGLEYGTDIFYYLHDRAAQAANMRSDFLAEPSRRILALLTGMENMPPKLEFDAAPALVWVMTESVSVEEIGYTTLVGSPRMYRITHHKPPLNLTKDRHWKLEVQDLEDPWEWAELNNCQPVEDLQRAAQNHFNEWYKDNQPAGFIVENGMQGKPLEAAGRVKAALSKAFNSKPPSILVDGNPKTQFGVTKPAAWYVPGIALFKTGLAHMHGALKYGHFNWRDEPMSSSVLINAAFRHMFAWKEGEDCAQDSGIDHLAHAAACLNILMDAQHHGNLNDDRHDSKTDFEKLYRESKPIIKQIEKDAAMLHASKPTNNEDK